VHDSVTVHMSASPQAVWELVSDVTNTGKFSPETFEAEWIEGSTGPAVGARFRGHVKRNGKGPTYWTKCTVTECEPGKVFEFGVDGRPGGQPVNTWRYEFKASGDGADVTESFTLANMLPFRLYWAVMGRFRGRTNVNGMRTTLERIKAVVEA
jgi:uncharacterized protein YndB with AHSA1/START domain